MHPGVPAEHRRRLVHDGHRDVSERARLHEQHLLPHGRGDFNNRTSSRRRRSSRRTRCQQAAERAGKKVAQIEWVGSRAAQPGQGPVVDFRNFFSNRGVLTSPRRPGRAGRRGRVRRLLPGRRLRAGQRLDEHARRRRRGQPAAADGPDRRDDVRCPEPEPDLRRLPLRQRGRRRRPPTTAIVLARTGVRRTRRRPPPTSASATGSSPADRGRRPDRRACRPDGRASTSSSSGSTARPGRSSSFKLYFTVASSRARSPCNVLPCDRELREAPRRPVPDRARRPTSRRSRRASSTRTHTSSRASMWADFHLPALEYILDELQPDTDLLFLGNPITDEFQHQFLALTVPDRHGRQPEPVLRRRHRTTTSRTAASAIREGYIRSAYQEADETLALGRELMGGGRRPSFAVVRPRLRAAVVGGQRRQGPDRRRASRRPSRLSNCRAADGRRPPVNQAKACWAGGTAQIYINSRTAPPRRAGPTGGLRDGPEPDRRRPSRT